MVTCYLYSLPVIPYRYWCFWACFAKQLPEYSANVANVGCPNSRYDSKVATGRKIKFQKSWYLYGTWPFGRGTSLLGGLTITMVINHYITRMILQEGGFFHTQSKLFAPGFPSSSKMLF